MIKAETRAQTHTKEKREMNERKITEIAVTLVRADMSDWLNYDSQQTPEFVAEMADRYCAAYARKLQAAYPGAALTVELSNPGDVQGSIRIAYANDADDLYADEDRQCIDAIAADLVNEDWDK
jgi:hypothetical protein